MQLYRTCVTIILFLPTRKAKPSLYQLSLHQQMLNRIMHKCLTSNFAQIRQHMGSAGKDSFTLSCVKLDIPNKYLWMSPLLNFIQIGQKQNGDHINIHLHPPVKYSLHHNVFHKTCNFSTAQYGDLI